MDCLIFDFDGVILDSNGVKINAFREIFSEDGTKEEIDEFIDYHLESGGISRFVKIAYFYENILLKPISEAEILEKAEKFGEIVLSSFANGSAIIEDTLAFIKSVHTKVPLHIASGGLESELKQICQDLHISQYFRSIHGSPTPKVLLINEILKANGYDPKRCVMFGDSIKDYEAASMNKIKFFGYNKESLRTVGEGYLDSFKEFNLKLID